MYIIDEWTCSAVAFLVVGRCNLYAPSAWRPVAPFAWKNAKFIGRGQQIIRRFFRQSLRFLPCWAKKERPRSASIWNTVCTTWNLPWGDKMAYGNVSAWCHMPQRQGGRAMFRQKKNGQTNKIHLSIRFGGASGSRTLAPVSRPIAFRVRPLTTTWVMLQILNFRMPRAFWENFGENFRRERPKIVRSRSRKTRMKPSKIGNPLPKSQLDFECGPFDLLGTSPYTYQIMLQFVL